MSKKRMRVFAGPNGSGKTTIINRVKNEVSFGIYVNADDIEKTLTENKLIHFSDYNVELTTREVQSYFKQSQLSPIKHDNENLWKNISIKNNCLLIHETLEIDSYLAADIAELLRQKLLTAKVSFTYETVMSHPGKMSFLKKALENGYRVYLYYIATEDPEININRVNVRVAQNGHMVKREVNQKKVL